MLHNQDSHTFETKTTSFQYQFFLSLKVMLPEYFDPTFFFALLSVQVGLARYLCSFLLLWMLRSLQSKRAECFCHLVSELQFQVSIFGICGVSLSLSAGAGIDGCWLMAVMASFACPLDESAVSVSSL